MTGKIGLFVALLAALIIAVLIIGSRTLYVSAMENVPTPEKHYISYEVKPGDSLWSLAEIYSEAGGCSVTEYIAEVKKVNRMSSDCIISGTKLFLICYE